MVEINTAGPHSTRRTPTNSRDADDPSVTSVTRPREVIQPTKEHTEECVWVQWSKLTEKLGFYTLSVISSINSNTRGSVCMCHGEPTGSNGVPLKPCLQKEEAGVSESEGHSLFPLAGLACLLVFVFGRVDTWEHYKSQNPPGRLLGSPARDCLTRTQRKSPSSFFFLFFFKL